MSVPQTRERQNFAALTSLRFFAAALVVIYHVALFNTLTLPGYISGLLIAGYEAVTFFFVLSGFILGHNYLDGLRLSGMITTERLFWLSRIARIVPLYYFALLISAPAFLYGYFVGKTVPGTVLLLGLVFIPVGLQAWIPSIAIAWNAPAWSLSVETFFYALFPILARATRNVSPMSFLTLAMLLVAVMSFLRVVVFPPHGNGPYDHYEYFYIPVFHLPQFIFGVALARLVFAIRASLTTQVSSVLFLVGSSGALAILGSMTSLPLGARSDVVLCIFYGLVILGGTRLDGLLRKVLCTPAFVLLGNASYAIYLLHSPIWFWWITAKKYLYISPWNGLDFVIYAALVISISILSYLYLELPLRRRILGAAYWSPRGGRA